MPLSEATLDSHWDQTGVGDGGTSHGICQVAARNTSARPNHAFPGFTGISADLALQSTAFNADFWAGHLYSAFHGLTGETAGGDIPTAVETWLVGHATGPGRWWNENRTALD